MITNQNSNATEVIFGELEDRLRQSLQNAFNALVEDVRRAGANRDRKLEKLLMHHNALVDKHNETLKQIQDNFKEVKHVEGRV